MSSREESKQKEAEEEHRAELGYCLLFGGNTVIYCITKQGHNSDTM